MKILKLIEKVTFAVSTIVTVVALTLLSMLDTTLPVSGVILPYFVIGPGFAVLTLLVGTFLHFVKHRPTSLVGDALVIGVNAVVFGVALAAIISGDSDVSIIVAFVGTIIYIASCLVRFIVFIVNKVNNVESSDDPEKDPAIQNVLKWKALKEDGIISEEEYEAKRVKLLHLEKKEAKK